MGDGYVMSHMLRDFHNGRCWDEFNNCDAYGNMEDILDAEHKEAVRRLREENRKVRKCFEEMGVE